MKEENDSLKTTTSKVMLENYSIGFETLKRELSDVNKRFSEYIESSNKRDESYRQRISDLERSNKEKDEQIKNLDTKINILLEERKSTN